jgi:hypothetical protein
MPAHSIHVASLHPRLEELNMKRLIVLASFFTVAASVAVAQTGGGGKGPGAGPGSVGPAAGASAPGMGMGMGPRGARGPGRWGPDHTPGWALMTEQERNEHRERMRAMTTYEECRAYREQHHEQMTARAKERGGQALTQPRRDACAALKR